MATRRRSKKTRSLTDLAATIAPIKYPAAPVFTYGPRAPADPRYLLNSNPGEPIVTFDIAADERERQAQSDAGKRTVEMKRAEKAAHIALAQKLIRDRPTANTDELAKLIGHDCGKRDPANKCTHRTISDHVREARKAITGVTKR